MADQADWRSDATATASAFLSFVVDRQDLTKSAWRHDPAPHAIDPAPGRVLVRNSKFAFTSNNVTYAKLGDDIEYWRFFPAPAPWGQIPVWGIGEIVQSRHPELAEGERLYGYFPMASHLVIEPARVKTTSLIDGLEHRATLPPTYNEYARIDRNPDYDERGADERLVLRPLFSLSFFLSEYLIEAGLFGAKVVIISSASSKTALGLAFLLAAKKARDVQLVGLTSMRNLSFVARAGRYDSVVNYDEIDNLPIVDAIFVDIAGDRSVLRAVHRHFGDRIRHSSRVGATHWDDDSEDEDLPGAKPQWFFTPDHILRRRREWGPAVLRGRQFAALREFLADANRWLRLEYGVGPQAVERVYRTVLDGRVAPEVANILSLGVP